MAVERRKDSKGRVLKDREYQRPNGTYEYKWKDENGVRHSAYAKTLSALRKKEEEIAQNICNDSGLYSSKATLNDIFKIWVETKRGIRPTTMDMYYINYEKHIKDFLGKKQIKDIKKSTVKLLYNQMLDEGKKLNTICVVHNVLRQVLQMAVDDECIRSNPTDGAIKDVRNAYDNNGEKRIALTYSQQKALEGYLLDDGCKFHRWYPIIITLLWTGMRFGECSALTWDDVDFGNSEIHVRRTMIYNLARARYDSRVVETYSVHSPKTRSGIRTIPMLPVVRDALQLEKQIQQNMQIKVSPVIDGIGNFVFLNSAGNVCSNCAMNTIIKRIIVSYNNDVIKKHNAGSSDKEEFLPHFSCHNLRHTMATRMCEAGINVKVMQEILGHSDYGVTMNIYTDVTSDYKKMQAKEFASYFKDNAYNSEEPELMAGNANQSDLQQNLRQAEK